jgi:hypothetical protein
MESDTSSSDIEYSESVDELLLEKDEIIDNLNTRVVILNALNDILKERIINLQNVINSNLPPYLNSVLEFL